MSSLHHVEWHSASHATPEEQIIDYRRVTSREQKSKKPNARLDKCITYIEENLTAKITLNELAQLAGCDKYQIIRTFRRAMGITPHAYIVSERVALAAAMMSRGEPAAAVASEVGFVDQSHLIKYFKRHLGTTPKRYLSRQRLAPRQSRRDRTACAAGCGHRT
jgi:transcriptional regulator GlxA family with amidase domain